MTMGRIGLEQAGIGVAEANLAVEAQNVRGKCACQRRSDSRPAWRSKSRPVMMG